MQSEGLRVSTAHVLYLLLAQPSPRGDARLGVVASRKVGDAVARNRCKRLLRELFRLHPDRFPPGVDVVAIARGGLDALGLGDLEAELAKAAPALSRRAAEALAGRATEAVALAPARAEIHPAPRRSARRREP